MRQLGIWIDRLWQWISSKVFVRFEFAFQHEPLVPPDRSLFALTHGGIIEWLILSSWCRTHGFAPILVANRLSILLLAKPLYFFQVLFGARDYSDLFFLENEKGPRLIFVPPHERKKPFKPNATEKLLAEIYSKERGLEKGPRFRIFPVFLLWRRHARSETRSFGEHLFGLSSDPNLLGKWWYLLRKRRDSTVRLMTPFPLESKDSSDPHLDGEDPEPVRIARALRRRILVDYQTERRVFLGPKYLSPQSVKETLMRDPDIQRVIGEVAEAEKVDRRKIAMRAYKNLTEVAASYRYRFIEMLYVFLNWLFNKVFDGLVVDESELATLRETMRTKPVVLVPCHRSHLDYLVFPYLMFTHNMATPHTVAGINLSFWPIGPILRYGGAFFIRRSFRGDPLYAICVKKYVHYLLTNRYNLMFFIEGTRSRTGKMLPPQYGMLKMIAEAQQSKGFDDIMLFPVALAYDEIPEEKAYTKELSGGQKTKESAKEFLKTREITRRNMGKVYVRLAPSLSMKAALEQGENAGLDSKLVLQKTAFQISKSINDCTPVTPKSLVCSVFLGHPTQQLPLDQAFGYCETLAEYLSSVNARLSIPPKEPLFLRTAELAVRKMVKTGLLSVTESSPRLYFCEPKKRGVLNFYKNGAIHHLVVPAITTTALLMGPREQVVQKSLDLRNLLKFDFFFDPSSAFVEEIKRCADYLSKGKPNPERDALFARLLSDLWESYGTVVRFFEDQSRGQFEKKALTKQITKVGEKFLDADELKFPESISVQSYANAFSLLENHKILIPSGEDKPGELTFVGPNAELTLLGKKLATLRRLAFAWG